MTIQKALIALSLAIMSASAQAAPILNVSGEGLSAAQAAEAAFLSSVVSATTETFESFTAGAGSQSTTIATSVGNFTMNTPGIGGLCDDGDFDCNDGVAVLDSATTPFKGRFAVESSGSDAASNNWLDSMDAQAMTFTPNAAATAIGFYITDPNDAGGRLDIGGFNFDFEDIFGSSLRNGRVFFVSLFDTAGLGSLTFYSNNRDDGFGLDNVTIAQVPEPGTMALLGFGLIGLVMLRRRTSDQR